MKMDEIDWKILDLALKRDRINDDRLCFGDCDRKRAEVRELERKIEELKQQRDVVEIHD